VFYLTRTCQICTSVSPANIAINDTDANSGSEFAVNTHSDFEIPTDIEDGSSVVGEDDVDVLAEFNELMDMSAADVVVSSSCS
jgi:hypothetical protein